MEKLLDLVFISAFVLVVQTSGIIDRIKLLTNWQGRMKPFDCSFCLSFWMTLGYCLLTGEGLYSIGWASITCLFTVFIEKRI